jgi:hypothetical protein
MTTQADFAERCAAVVDELGLLYAGEPDEKVSSSLATMRANLVAELTKMFTNTDEDLRAMVDGFIQAILSGQSITARQIRRARGTLRNGRPRRVDQPAVRMAA